MITLFPKINDFFVVLFSILIEGIPFILIGGILSAFVEIFVSEEKIKKLMPKNQFAKFGFMGLLGNVTPVCECGNVPFARRMILKKIQPHLVLTFLLAAPVFNPIVIAATIAAFPNDFSVVFFRLLFTFVIAVSIGCLFSVFSSKEILLPYLLRKKKSGHVHKHSFMKILNKEFIEMTGIFLFGAVLASFIQIVIPKELLFQFYGQEWTAILAMMILAFVVSICSNVDAFFALAYSQIFPTSSILAFLVLGPMIDIKAIPLFKTIFNWKALGLIISLIFTEVFLLSYLYFLFT